MSFRKTIFNSKVSFIKKILNESIFQINITRVIFDKYIYIYFSKFSHGRSLIRPKCIHDDKMLMEQAVELRKLECLTRVGMFNTEKMCIIKYLQIQY